MRTLLHNKSKKRQISLLVIFLVIIVMLGSIGAGCAVAKKQGLEIKDPQTTLLTQDSALRNSPREKHLALLDQSQERKSLQQTAFKKDDRQIILFDDFEYHVSRDGNPAVNLKAFQNAGWHWVKAINLPKGSHNGYLYTVDVIPGYSGSFPGMGSKRALAIEARPSTLGSQTDFYLQFGDGLSEALPGNIWYQFWLYTNDYGKQRSRFSGRDKLLYPCNGQYPCHNLRYLLYSGSANPPYWTNNLGLGSNERFLMLYDNSASLDDGTVAKLGHNMDSYHLMPNKWQLVKLHFDTSGPQGIFEVWIKPLGGEFVKVAEWIGGKTPGFTWHITNPGGHKMLRMPTTLPGANNNQFYDSWVYMDDFVISTSEAALPEYSH